MAGLGEVPAEQLKQMLEDAQRRAEKDYEKGKKDAPMSAEETDKFRKAFDDPEFRRMFSEYMDELSDPKHREETEQYIAQLEGEQKVPQGKELIRPQPSFVAKTHKVDKTQSETKGDKVWLNIVQSDKITEPSKVVTKEGENWSLPYSLGPPHMEKDQKDINVACFDCCFHPTAIALAGERKQFRDLLVQTAIDGVEEGFRRQNNETKLSREFHILKGVTYKSGQIPAMMIDVSSKQQWSGNAQPPQAATAAAVLSKTTTTSTTATTKTSPELISGVGSATKTEPAIKKGFLNKEIGKEKGDKAAAGGGLEKGLITEPPPGSGGQQAPKIPKTPLIQSQTAGVASEGGPVEPSYTIKERGLVSWGDFDQQRSDTSRPPQSTRPKELVVTIHIPRVTAASEMILDVKERLLVFRYRTEYHLSLPLPYAIFDEKGAAKFDKTGKTLTVTLPLKLPPSTPRPPRSPTSPKTDDKIISASSEVEEPATEPKGQKQRQHQKSKDSHQRWVSGASEEEQKQAQHLKEEIKRQAEEALKAPPIPPSPAAPASAVQAAKPPPVPAPDFVIINGEPFVASSSFAGRKEGYVFKRGAQGVGYYLDAEPSTAQERAEVIATKRDTNSVAKEFPFEFRQTPKAIAVLVQVPGIDPTSVTISYETRVTHVLFRSDETLYALDLVASQDLDVDSCHNDVQPKNLCLVLVKKSEKIWDDSLGPILKATAYTQPPPVVLNNVPGEQEKLAALRDTVDKMSFSSASNEMLFELD